MRRSVRWTLCASVVTALAMFLAACGGNDNGGGGGGGGTVTTQTKVQEGKKGGSLTFLAAGDVDWMDPGQTYYTFGYQVAYAVNRTLYSFKPDDSIKPVPDLAEGEPEISADNKTVTVHLKKGIKYAPPVNREVKAADIKYAFERSFSKEVPSGYAGTYFGTIVGTPDKPNSGDIKPISGIETPDDSTIVFKLKDATAPLISQALVMPITTPVPQEYAEKYDKSTPSKYNQYVAFTGPYMVKNDPTTGKLTGWQPGKQIQMVRNPNWDAKTDYRPAYLDSVTIEEGNDDLTTAARRALNGSGLACCDSGAPPAPVLKQALQRNKDQVVFVPSGGTRYIAFNMTVKPFDNINIRKAIIAFSDRNALRLTRGGAVLGDIATGWIPPDFPGFKEGGGLKQNTDLDYLKNPNGDPALAKKYMLAAKKDDPSLPIDANGKWTGGEKILTVATNADPGKKTAEVFQGQIEQLGFKLNFRVVPQDSLYTKFCSEPEAKVAICPNVGWFKDFVDPQSMLDATFNGKNILQHGNVNWPQLNVPAINDAMKQASTLAVGTERNTAWAKINHMIAEQAPAIPWIWDKSATVASKNVQLVVNGYDTAMDLNFSSLK
ncbi:MAG TPA: ABC transporter substrate-binding protein [Solirubrobacteraceae bacterium]